MKAKELFLTIVTIIACAAIGFAVANSRELSYAENKDEKNPWDDEEEE